VEGEMESKPMIRTEYLQRFEGKEKKKNMKKKM